MNLGKLSDDYSSLYADDIRVLTADAAAGEALGPVAGWAKLSDGTSIQVPLERRPTDTHYISVTGFTPANGVGYAVDGERVYAILVDPAAKTFRVEQSPPRDG